MTAFHYSVAVENGVVSSEFIRDEVDGSISSVYWTATLSSMKSKFVLDSPLRDHIIKAHLLPLLSTTLLP